MIELRGVSKTVDSGGQPLTILHPLDYTIASGQFVAIVGPSGSGKSTLLGLLAGLDAPTSGSIVVDGTDITTLGEDRLARLRGEKIGFVFQFFHLVPSLTAFENVLIPMELPAGAMRRHARASSCRRLVSRSARITIHRSCRAANSSGLPSPARWRTIRRSCLPTSRRAISTPPPAVMSWTS
jgi:putative ABC transport system ATP-binding protein